MSTENTTNNTPSRIQVGVYGTLKKGFSRHTALGEDAKLLGSVWVRGMMLHNTGYPVLIVQPEDKELLRNDVEVFVYDVSADVLDSLDRIEGHPALFERRIVQSRRFGDVFVYFGHTDSWWKGERKVIFGGKWNGPETPYWRVDFGQTKDAKPRVIQGVWAMLRTHAGGLIENKVGPKEVGFSREECYYSTAKNRYEERLTGRPVKWDSAINRYIYDLDAEKRVPASTPTPPPEPEEPGTITVPKSETLNSPFPSVKML